MNLSIQRYNGILQFITRFFHKSLRSRILLTCTVFIVFLMSLSIVTLRVSANDHPERVKKVISIQVKSGDTLWSIASDYYTDEYESINEYIDEIKATNHLHTDVIHSGNYLVIPYYDAETNPGSI